MDNLSEFNRLSDLFDNQIKDLGEVLHSGSPDLVTQRFAAVRNAYENMQSSYRQLAENERKQCIAMLNHNIDLFDDLRAAVEGVLGTGSLILPELEFDLEQLQEQLKFNSEMEFEQEVPARLLPEGESDIAAIELFNSHLKEFSDHVEQLTAVLANESPTEEVVGLLNATERDYDAIQSSYREMHGHERRLYQDSWIQSTASFIRVLNAVSAANYPASSSLSSSFLEGAIPLIGPFASYTAEQAAPVNALIAQWCPKYRDFQTLRGSLSDLQKMPLSPVEQEIEIRRLGAYVSLLHSRAQGTGNVRALLARMTRDIAGFKIDAG